VVLYFNKNTINETKYDQKIDAFGELMEMKNNLLETEENEIQDGEKEKHNENSKEP